MDTASKPQEFNKKYDFHFLDPLKSDYFSPLIKSYLKKEESFPWDMVNSSSETNQIKTITESSLYNHTWRNKLADVIHRQYNNLLPDQKPLKGSLVYENIESLRDPKCLTVTTGQQIHIFMGPLFVWYKIISCLEEAKRLKHKHPEQTFVPIFWMATEDHDFEEIKSTYLYGQKYTWEIESEGPVGRLNPKSLLGLVEQLANRLDDTPMNDEFIEVCKTAYTSYRTYAQANLHIYNHYFAETGLVVLDPDDAELKDKFKPIIKDDLHDGTPSKIISDSISKLKTYGIKAPINVRDNNHFLISDTKRERLLSKEDHLIGHETGTKIEKTVFSSSVLDTYSQFSPNALLRPVYQQYILPNICYVSGAGEFMYWLELKGLMDNYSIPYPNLLIRNSNFILSEKLFKRLTQNTPDKSILLASTELYSKSLLKQNNETESMELKRIEALELAVKNVLQSKLLEEPTGDLRMLKKQLEAINKNIHNTEKSFSLALMKSNELVEKKVKLKEKLVSSGFNQERNNHIINYITTLSHIKINSIFGTFSDKETPVITLSVEKM